MGGVFINYRVGDGATISGFLHQELIGVFGAEEVFYASRRIAPGDLFDREILAALHECEVLLAVIGPRWLATTDTHGVRRLDEPQDWVRREISEALAIGIRVIPILIEDAPMPAAEQLPKDIRDLARCTYLRLGHRHGEADATALITLLRQSVPRLAAIRPPASQFRGASSHTRLTGDGQVIVPVPQQLPADVRGFVNRLADLERLDMLLSKDVEKPGGVSVCVIAGTAGVGKTSLTVHWAHQVRSRFPDGQLYINLRGYDPGEPVTPAQALERFLEALGILPGAIPADLEARGALFRSLLADMRMLIVLDNAATVSQIRPLLPGADQCLTLVTSRNRLSGLVARDGAQRVTLNVFDEPAAIELLHSTTAGYRAGDDDSQVAELARLCARLPLALRIAAERAAALPRMPLDMLIADLRDESSLWDALASDDDEEADAVRTVFAWSYRALSEPAAHLFRLLGLHPTPEFSTHAASTLAALSVNQTRHLLDTLVGAHLLEQSGPDRWQFHDLLRAYATDQARHEESVETQHLALHRILTWYLHAANAAVRAMVYVPMCLVLNEPYERTGVLALNNHREAVRWYETERLNLVAAVQVADKEGVDDIAWQIPAVLGNIYPYKHPFDEWFTVTQIGLEAARRAGHRIGEARLLWSLGAAYTQSQQPIRALERLREALAIYRTAGDRAGEATCLHRIGLAYYRLHLISEARTATEQALDIAHELGDPGHESWSLYTLAASHRELGLIREAHGYASRAVAIAQENSWREDETDGLIELCKIQRDLGQLEEATATAQRTLAIASELDDAINIADVLIELGQIQRMKGQHADALTSYQEATVLQRRLAHASREARALDGTGEVYRELGRYDEAIDFHRRAAAIHCSFDDRWHTAVALDHLANALSESGRTEEARTSWREALPLLNEFEDPKALALRTSIQTALDEH